MVLRFKWSHAHALTLTTSIFVGEGSDCLYRAGLLRNFYKAASVVNLSPITYSLMSVKRTGMWRTRSTFFNDTQVVVERGREVISRNQCQRQIFASIYIYGIKWLCPWTVKKRPRGCTVCAKQLWGSHFCYGPIWCFLCRAFVFFLNRVLICLGRDIHTIYLVTFECLQ